MMLSLYNLQPQPLWGQEQHYQGLQLQQQQPCPASPLLRKERENERIRTTQSNLYRHTYSVFFQHKRRRMISGNPRGVGFANLPKELSKKWNEMDQASGAK
jgi:hypothetical protein